MYLSCKQASRLLSEQLDHPLSLWQRIRLKIHLAACTNCLFFGRQIRALKHLIGLHTDSENLSPTDATLSDEVREQIKKCLDEES